MIIKLLANVLIGLLNLCFSWLSFPDFGVNNAFNSSLTWISTFTDSVTSLIAFLIPRPVFMSSIALFIAIHELDHALELINFILSKIPVVRNLAWRTNIVGS